jgi:hypothetical protein
MRLSIASCTTDTYYLSVKDHWVRQLKDKLCFGIQIEKSDGTQQFGSAWK